MSKNMMAVQDFSGDAGATVWWTLSGQTYLTRLAAAWEEQGLDAAWLPSLPSADKRLSRAVATTTEMRKLRRPISRRGHWALVEEEVADTRLVHTQLLSVCIEYGLPRFEVLHYRGYDLRDQIEAAFNEQEGLLDRDDLALWLSSTIQQRLFGVALRPRGGMYYVLPAQVDTWRRVVAAVNACRLGSCYTLPTLKGEEATRAVLDALVRDVEDEATTYAESIGNVGARALRARVQDCDALLERLSQYDTLLGGALTTVRARVTSVQDAALTAAFKAEAAEMAAE